MASRSGLGTTTLWGLTPAVNLLSFIDEKTLLEADNGDNALNLLLFGQADMRHVLKTLEEHFSFSAREIKINIFILENHVEQYARQLLFAYMMQLSTKDLGLYERTKHFLELYGNTYLRPRTQKSMVNWAKDLIELVTNSDYIKEKLPFVSITDLKFNEKDAITEIFKYWSENCDSTLENMNERWDRRLRYHLGVRYDSRTGVFDWDYNMRLLDEGATNINSREYKRWRTTGMAFQDYESEYNQPNITLNTGASQTKNLRNICFMGEIVTGPYISFGLECDDKSVMRKTNDIYEDTASNISQYNVSKIFTALDKLNGNDPSGGNEEALGEGGGGDNRCTKAPGSISLESLCTITFLPIEGAKSLCKKARYANKFQLVYFSSPMAQYLTPEMTQVMADGATVLVEGVRYLLELRKESIEAYDEKVEDFAKAANLSRPKDDSHLLCRDYHVYVYTKAGSTNS